MKNVLVLIHDDPGQEARLQVALDLARLLDGHLTCLDLTYIPPIIGGGFYEDAYAMADLMTQEVGRESANKRRIEARLAAEDVRWDWREASGDAASSLRKAADWADVIVINRHLDDATVIDMRRTAADLIVRSGKPVLAVPQDCRRFAGARPLIAWDGSDASVAALRAAVPLLAKAEEALLIEEDDGSVASSVEDAATYLSRHAVHPQIRRETCRRGEAGERLLAHLRGGGFDYLVMGGFGHRRFVEALFGGVTRTMLSESPVPVLLAR